MHLVRKLSPADYLGFHARFSETASYLELTPADRNLAWREQTEDEDFHEWPVPIEHFISDPYYIGPDVVIRPLIGEFLSDFWNPQAGMELFCLIAGLGVGKACALDTPIPTPTGTRRLEQLSVGDQVFDEFKKPCRVTATRTWLHRPCYRLTFSSGGKRSEIVADVNHEWLTNRDNLPGEHLYPTRDLRFGRHVVRSPATWEFHELVEIVPTELRTTRCIEVDSPSHMFLVGDAEIPTHNSFLGTITLLYAIYQLGCLKKPARYLSSFEGAGSLSGDAEIVLANASGGGYKQAQKIVFAEALERVVKSPWYMTRYQPYEGRTELEFPNRVRLSPVTSHWESMLGWNLYGFVIDEAAFGVESKRTDYIKELFQNANLRRRSRFGKAGFGGLFTSPGSEHGFIELLAADRRDPHILVRRTTTWDAKEELKPGAEVFLLSRDPDRVRIVEEGLTFVRRGVCTRADGSVVRYASSEQEDERAEVTA